jgi:lipopolysaccharide assembly outer membrane protein LptD (OstA)
VEVALAFGSKLFITSPIAFNDTIDLPDTIPVIPAPDELIDYQPYFPTDTIPDFEADTLPETTPRQQAQGLFWIPKWIILPKTPYRFDIRRQIVHLYGDADLKYGTIHLTAAYVSIDFKTNELFAQGAPDSLGQMQGKPVFTDVAKVLNPWSFVIIFKPNGGRTIQVITEEADGFMHGEVVKMMENRVIHVRDGKYTTCDDPNPHFHISFRRAKDHSQ